MVAPRLTKAPRTRRILEAIAEVADDGDVGGMWL